MQPILRWTDPWYPIDDGGPYEAELALELIPGHQLYGRRVVALGRKDGADDVLFWLADEGPRLASVHLTWIGKSEQTGDWPATAIFDDPDVWSAHTELAKLSGEEMGRPRPGEDE